MLLHSMIRKVEYRERMFIIMNQKYTYHLNYSLQLSDKLLTAQQFHDFFQNKKTWRRVSQNKIYYEAYNVNFK